MRCFVTIVFIFFSCLNLSAQKQMKYHRARIFYSTPSELEELSELGLEIDHGLIKKNIFIQSDFSQEEIFNAQKAGFSTEIIINDVQDFYIRQNTSNKNYEKNLSCIETITYPTPANFELGSMGGFFTYDEILAELDAMSNLYPNLISGRSPISDFSTEEGRSIFWMRMSDNPNTDEDEPEMLYDAVHHAREPASVSTLIFYMWYLLENYDTSEEVQAILNNTELYFVPVVNPDGYEYNIATNPNGGGLWRKNRRLNNDGSFGVDNNRNYSYEWGTTGVSSSPNGQTYPGTAPFSEVENQAMKWMCENHDFIMAFNNHSYSNLLLYPFGYDVDQPTPDDELFQVISEEMVLDNGYINQLAADLYPASGDADDWMYVATSEKEKILAFTPEIGSQSQGFWPPSNQIIDLCNSTMYMNLTAAHMVTKYSVVSELSPALYPSLPIDIPVMIKRMGLQDTDFQVSIEPLSSNIESVSEAILFSDLEILEESQGVVSITLDESILSGDLIQYYLIVDNGDYQSSKLITKTFGQEVSILEENANDVSNWNSLDWTTTIETFVSSPTSITDSPNSEYQNNSSTSIELTEEIDLTNSVAANMHFQAKWEIEEGWDYSQVQVSIDNGVSWIPQCGNFTTVGNSNQAENEPLYDGFQTNWVEESIDFSDYLDQIIKVRFVLITDGYVTEDGFYFDDLQINIVPSCLEENEEICDDGNYSTINDIIQDDCTCQGEFIISLELKAFLQGPYDSAELMMNDPLRSLGVIPITEPYTFIGESHVIGGSEITTSEILLVEGNNAIVDWVFIELRNGENSLEVIETQAGLLQRDGDIVSSNDGVSPLVFANHSGYYNSIYVAIKHRNHFGVRNLNPMPIEGIGDVLFLDFTDPELEVFGDGMARIQIGEVSVMISGDANRDGQINPVDKNDFWRVENGMPFFYLGTKADFNLDGAVNPVDKNTYWRINNSKVEQLD